MNRRDAMNEERLVTYLKDHLAGAVLGMELIEACREHSPSGVPELTPERLTTERNVSP
jgi:hypothetical protein